MQKICAALAFSVTFTSAVSIEAGYGWMNPRPLETKGKENKQGFVTKCEAAPDSDKRKDPNDQTKILQQDQDKTCFTYLAQDDKRKEQVHKSCWISKERCEKVRDKRCLGK